MSSKKRSLILVFAVAMLAAGVLLDRAYYRFRRDGAVVETQVEQVSDFEKYHRRKFRVERVVDGDTIDIAIPDGKYQNTRIRLWGVDTPETDKSPSGEMYYGPESTEFVKELVQGKTVTVYLDKGNNSRDRYGRLLAYIKVPEGGFLNEVLLSEGMAYADIRFEHSSYNKYSQLEAAARSLKKGLWQDVTREQFPGWLRREKPDLLK